MPEINRNLYPKGGYFFVDADGVKHSGPSWTHVIRTVTLYRQRRGIPVGDVQAEVFAQACERSPEICREGGTVTPAKPKPDQLKTRVFAWLGERARAARQKGLDYVSDAEARQRAAICQACPAATSFSLGCKPCAASLAVLRDTILAGRQPVTTSLGVCAKLGADLRVAVSLAEPPLTVSDLPAACWRRKV